MATLTEIIGKVGITFYHKESLDLDHYYQEPYQDEGEEIADMGDPFETDKSKKMRNCSDDNRDREFSLFSYFMDGSRRTYKIGDIVLEGKKIYPVVVAQIRAGCTKRNADKKLHAHGEISRKNLLLLSDKINKVDFEEVKQRIQNTSTGKKLNLIVEKYEVKVDVPTNAAIAKANSMMHDMEIDVLQKMVNSKVLDTNRMLIVDGPLQFIKQDTGKPEFADLFYDVVGVSKSFDPMLPTSGKTKRKATQIGAELVKLRYGERTPVFRKVNTKGRKFGCWYLRIRPEEMMSNPLEGIVKIEKMATSYDIDRDGLKTPVVDNISKSILNEGSPTCYGRDKRWPSHLYPVYLTETLIKSSFESDLVFINNFKRDF